MDVAITGSTGLIGSALMAYLARHGYRVLRLVRPKTRRPLSSARVVPAALEAAGLRFGDPLLEPSLRRIVSPWPGRTPGVRAS
jgi:NAD dependent epimerase/dehydratase family enzyme